MCCMYKYIFSHTILLFYVCSEWDRLAGGAAAQLPADMRVVVPAGAGQETLSDLLWGGEKGR